MKVGILGFSGVGKTTVFAALTGHDISRSIPGERHLASVEVVDRRLDHLREVFQPKKFTRARFEVDDLPALPRGDLRGKGEVLGAQREPDTVLLVVGDYEEAHLALPDELKDPAAQLRSLEEDLWILDLDLIERRLHRLEEKRKKGGDKAAVERESAFVGRIRDALEAGAGATAEAQNADEQRLLNELRLFAGKPKVAVFNVAEERLGDAAVESRLLALAPRSVVLCAPVEREIAQLGAAERAEFLAEYGLEVPASERLTRVAYEALDLISFFTVGADEVRAWPIVRGADAVSAAGKIHTDLARGFIRAEVVPYALVEAARDEREYKSAAHHELKGKDYVVQDGDIVNIRFNV